jgi:hypothetical protein
LGRFVIQFFSVSELFGGSPENDRIREACRSTGTWQTLGGTFARGFLATTWTTLAITGPIRSVRQSGTVHSDQAATGIGSTAGSERCPGLTR